MNISPSFPLMEKKNIISKISDLLTPRKRKAPENGMYMYCNQEISDSYGRNYIMNTTGFFRNTTPGAVIWHDFPKYRPWAVIRIKGGWAKSAKTKLPPTGGISEKPGSKIECIIK